MVVRILGDLAFLQLEYWTRPLFAYNYLHFHLPSKQASACTESPWRAGSTVACGLVGPRFKSWSGRNDFPKNDFQFFLRY